MRVYTKKSLSLLTFILIFAGILILVNILSQGIWGRLDFTQDEVYSLTDATKDVLAEMDDEVEIRAYFSRDLPAHLGSTVTYVKDQLEDYQAYSHGNIKFSILDPAADKAVEEEATGMGCPPLTLQQMSSDQYATKKVFMCIAFMFEDKKELIPAVRGTTGLEYEVTSIIKKLTTRELKQIGVLQGHGEPGLMQNPYGQKPQGPMLNNLRQQLARSYKVEGIDTTAEDAWDKLKDMSSLLVISPQEPLKERDLYLIDQFIMSGKTVAFMIDKISTNLQQFQAQERRVGIEPLLEHYGATLNSDLVLDKFNQPISVQQQAGNIRYNTRMPYPYFPMLGNFRDNNGLNMESNIVQKLEMVTAPFISTLNLKQGLSDRTSTWLARSSAMSWKQSGYFTINPTQIAPAPEGGEMGPFTVAGTITGIFPSYFEAKAGESMEYTKGEPTIVRSPETRIFVMGNGTMATDQFLDGNNMNFLQNVVDWLVQDEALISIRSRGFVPQPLDPNLSANTKAVIKFGNILGVPLLFILFGVVLWQLRSARRRRLASTFFDKR